MDGPQTAKKMGRFPETPRAVVSFDTKNSINPNKMAPALFINVPPCL